MSTITSNPVTDSSARPTSIPSSGAVPATFICPSTTPGASASQPAPQGRSLRALFTRLRADQRGEGVISAAIAVLIMAFVGVAAFVAYKGIMTSVTDKTTECVNVYVTNSTGCE